MNTSKVLSVVVIEFLLILSFTFLNEEIGTIATSLNNSLGNVLELSFPILWIFFILLGAYYGIREGYN